MHCVDMNDRLCLGTCIMLAAACTPQPVTTGSEPEASRPTAGAERIAASGRSGRDVPAPEPQVPADQIEAMFRAAVAQAKPFSPQKAVCFGIDAQERTLRDPPEALRRLLSRELGLPGYPASQCSFDIYPFVTATREQAMLYTIRVIDAKGAGILFMAMATYGNLGAQGQEFRLVRRNGRWTPVPTGLRVMS